MESWNTASILYVMCLPVCIFCLVIGISEHSENGRADIITREENGIYCVHKAAPSFFLLASQKKNFLIKLFFNPANQVLPKAPLLLAVVCRRPAKFVRCRLFCGPNLTAPHCSCGLAPSAPPPLYI